MAELLLLAAYLLLNLQEGVDPNIDGVLNMNGQLSWEATSMLATV